MPVQRGRKSVEGELAVVHAIQQRRDPPPPADLTEAQAEEWRAVVARMPADWFTRETHGLLAAYCRHVTAIRLVSQLIDAFKADWLCDAEGVARFDRLLAMREREARSMSAIATRLRMTQQSRYGARTAATATRDAGTSGGPPPWERHA